MSVHSASSKGKLYVGASKVKKAYKGATKFYSSGNIVTYKVDTYVSYQEEVDEGEACLSPKSFTPAKDGWEFVGWRQDTSGGSVLGSLSMGDAPITLYAVFRQTVTVTYYNNSATPSSASGYRYYNNGNIVNPSFTLTQAARDGWTARGWSTSAAGNGGITYNNGVVFTRGGNVTLYGMYQQTITVTYYNNSTSASTASGTRYYNSGSGIFVNPSFTLTQAALSGWTACGWSTSTAGNGGITYSNATAFTRDSNVTLYGMYYQAITLTYYNGSTAAASTSGTRYYNSNGNTVNPTFSLVPATLSGWAFRGWATSSAAAAGIAYSSISGTAFSANATVYAAYSQTITLSYDGNGNTGGSTAAQTGTRYYNTGNYSNPSFTLSANGFSKTNYAFQKWAMESASGTQYAAGASVTLTASTTFYAVWEVVVKSAPPFLSAGWRTLVSYNWVATGYQNGITEYYIDTRDDGTRFISENEINAWYWVQENETQRGYLFYLPTPIDTSSFSEFSLFVQQSAFDDDTSEGTIEGIDFECCRFSNDGINWTPYWQARTTPDRSYKYAQVGFFHGGDSDSATAMWGKCVITSFTIQ